MPKEYKVEVRVRNNLILTAMLENGISNIAELCRRMGSGRQQGLVGLIVNLKLSPRNGRGEWRPVVLRMVEVLHRLPEDLFTAEQEEMKLKSNRGSFEVSFEEVRGLLVNRSGGHSPEAIMSARQLHSAVEKVLNTLTPQEERVLRLRFGLGVVEEHTLEEVAEQFEVSRERIRNIEASALRKLRYPSRSKLLLEIVGSGRTKAPTLFDIYCTELAFDEEVLDAGRDKQR